MPSSTSPSYICSSAHSKCVRTAALHLARLTAALHLSLHNSEVITPFRPFLQLKIFRPGRRNFTADFQEEKNCQNGMDCFFESCRCCDVPQKYVVSVYEYSLASILTFLEGMIRLQIHLHVQRWNQDRKSAFLKMKKGCCRSRTRDPLLRSV